MRDIAVTLIILGTLPFILRRPFYGVLVWTWLGLMNPHRLAWGFAAELPFAQIVFIVTLIGLLFSKEPKRIPVTREILVLVVFILWMLITTIYALFPVPAWDQFDKVWKIQLGILLTLMLTNSPERIKLLIWTVAVSLGFYGFKGGIWTLMTGGGERVYGPPNTFLGGNNELGLALVMTIPLLWYLITMTPQKWVRLGLYAGLGFTLVAIVGTHSRGALVGLAVMGFIFFMKSRRKIVPLILALAFVAVLPHVMPQEWFDRMHTIETYEEDQSAQGRFQAWRAAITMAGERLTGGGYEALVYDNGTDAHSIYFEVLAEHGYTGLVLFLLLAALTWMKASTTKRLAKKDPDYRWAAELATMLQVSMVGYAASGAFLGLAYFDLYYILVVIIVVLHLTVVSGGIVLGDQRERAVAPTQARSLNGFMPGPAVIAKSPASRRWPQEHPAGIGTAGISN